MSGGMTSLMGPVMNFWRTREPREQWTLGVGLLALVLMLFYQLIWTPIDRWAEEQQHRRDNDVALAAYVAQAKLTLSQQKKAATAPNAGNTANPLANQSAMQLAYTTAKAQGIDGRIDRRQPAGDNGVRLQFTAVDFAALSRWIGAMNQAGMTLEEAEITPSSGSKAGPGLVDAKLKLQGAAS